MRSLLNLPGWVKGAASFLLLAAIGGIVGNRTDAALLRALPLLSRNVSLFVGDLVLILAAAWLVGLFTVFLLQTVGIPVLDDPRTRAESGTGSTNVSTPKAGPLEKYRSELDDALNELAKGNRVALPQILSQLRYTFDQMGRSEDAAWCQAELNGYPGADVPEYRFANATFDWRSSGVAAVESRTGKVVGKPAESEDATIPVGAPLEDLMKLLRTGKKAATGEIKAGIMEAWHQIVIVSPDEIQGVVRRIADEAYRRAFAAKTTDLPA